MVEPLRITPKEKATNWKNRGNSLAKQGNYEGALACYNSGLNIDPNNRDIWHNKSLILEKLERFDEAEKCKNQLVQIQDAPIIDRGLIASLSTGPDSKNDRLIQKSESLSGGSITQDRKSDIVEVYDFFLKGNEFFLKGDYETALDNYEKHQQKYLDNFWLLNNKGLTLLKLGRFEEARICYKKIKSRQLDIPLETENGFKTASLCIENLPYPFTYYPGFEAIDFALSNDLNPNNLPNFIRFPPEDPGGSNLEIFLGFRKNINSPIYLCSCSKQAIVNYIKFKLSAPPSIDNSYLNLNFILSPENFPVALIDELLEKDCPNSEEIITKLNFKKNLCHECNKIPPYSICNSQKSRFYETWGWYVEKQRLEFGIKFNGPSSKTKWGNPNTKGSHSVQIIRPECPNEILSFLKSNKFEIINKKYDIVVYDVDRTEDLEIRHIIENAVRRKVGHKNIGEDWTNETKLYYIVKSIYPDLKIYRHYRPDFLNGLEIDIYIKELNLGIEYQGIQHFKPMKHYGGEEAFEKLKTRDKLKRTICQNKGIRLIFINYDEDVTEFLVKLKISH